MNFRKILGYIGNLFLKIDLGISFVLFRPLAGWIRDITGASQWSMARQALMGSGLVGGFYYFSKALTDSPWYWLAIIWLIYWLGRLEPSRIRKYEASENGAFEALVSDQFMRLWFLGAMAGLGYAAAFGRSNFEAIDNLAFLHFGLLLCSYYFRTVFMPPPRKRREPKLKEAFAYSGR